MPTGLLHWQPKDLPRLRTHHQPAALQANHGHVGWQHHRSGRRERRVGLLHRWEPGFNPKPLKRRTTDDKSGFSLCQTQLTFCNDKLKLSFFTVALQPRQSWGTWSQRRRWCRRRYLALCYPSCQWAAWTKPSSSLTKEKSLWPSTSSRRTKRCLCVAETHDSLPPFATKTFSHFLPAGNWKNDRGNIQRRTAGQRLPGAFLRQHSAFWRSGWEHTPSRHTEKLYMPFTWRFCWGCMCSVLLVIQSNVENSKGAFSGWTPRSIHLFRACLNEI